MSANRAFDLACSNFSKAESIRFAAAKNPPALLRYDEAAVADGLKRYDAQDHRPLKSGEIKLAIANIQSNTIKAVYDDNGEFVSMEVRSEGFPLTEQQKTALKHLEERLVAAVAFEASLAKVARKTGELRLERAMQMAGRAEAKLANQIVRKPAADKLELLAKISVFEKDPEIPGLAASIVADTAQLLRA